MASPPITDWQAPSSDAAVSDSHVRQLWIRVYASDVAGQPAIDGDLLASDLGHRLPSVRISTSAPVAADTSSDAGNLGVLADIRSDDQGLVRLTMIVSDGRAFDRQVSIRSGASANERHEVIARSIANLVAGIEAGVVVADREDVPMVEAAPAPDVVVCPPVEELKCPEVVPVESKPETVPAANVEPDARETEPSPRLSWGPGVSLGIVTGLGPPADADRFAAFGGDASMSIRWKSGAMLFVGVRPSGRASGRGDGGGLGVLRIRSAVGAGYAWRPSSSQVEVEAFGAVLVEPWIVLQQGTQVRFERATPPLVGGMLRSSVGYVTGRPGSRARVRIGGYAELAVAYAPGAGVVEVVERQATDPLPRFRLGGPEVTMGLEVRMWLGRKR